MFRVFTVGEDDITDEQWRGYFELHKELSERYDTPYSLVSWQTTRDRTLSRQSSERGNERAFILLDNQFAAWGGFNGRNIGTPGQAAFFMFDFIDQFTSPELERAIIEPIGRWMDKYDLKESFGVVNDAHRKQMAQRWGAKKLSRLDEYVLDRKSARQDKIEEWLTVTPRKHANLRLEFFQLLPERLVEPFSELLVETLGDMPEEADGGLPFHATVQDERKLERWRQKNGLTLYKYLLFDQGNELVAMTLVDVDLNNPANAFQQMTGITERYRGKGLAKWLKAAMYKKLGEDFPGSQRLITSMRSKNEPMTAINDQMGFQLVRRGVEYKLTPEIVAQYLGRTE